LPDTFQLGIFVKISKNYSVQCR